MKLRPKFPEALKSKCCDCQNNYADGRKDCRSRECPLYIKNPYRQLNPYYSWIFEPWSNHDQKRIQQGLTKTQYIHQVIIKGPNKITIGWPHLFRAKCFRCTGNFHAGPSEKGRVDCQVTDCPIYYWMPYRKKEPDYKWLIQLSCNQHHKMNMIVSQLSQEEYLQSLLTKIRTGTNLVKYNS